MGKLTVHEHYGKFRIRPMIEGHRVSLTFDTREEAELACLQFQVKQQKARMGLDPKPTQIRHFKEASQLWLDKRAPQKRKSADDKSIIGKHLNPFFKDLALNEINQLTVDEYQLFKKVLSPKTVANHITLLISILNYAKDVGWIQSLPRIRKPRISLAARNFRYLKSQNEIDTLLQIAKLKGDLYYTIYLTSIYTGMRQGEVAGLRRSDLNFETRLICVGRSFNGPTKNGETRFVPILDPLFEPLKRWLTSHSFEYVFPNSVGNLFTNSARIFDDCFHDCLKEAGLKPYFDGKRLRPYVTYHDLRHTFASHWVMRGGSLFKLQQILGHQSMDMTLRYSHLSPTAFQEDHSRLNSPMSFKNVVAINSQDQQR